MALIISSLTELNVGDVDADSTRPLVVVHGQQPTHP
jgi:hypothetical protein